MTNSTMGRTVARKIKEHRTAAGLSRDKLGERLAELGHPNLKHIATLSRVENGERPIRVDELEVFAAALGVTVGDLLGESSPFTVQAWRAYGDAARAMRESVAAYLDAGWHLLAMTDGEDEEALPGACSSVAEGLAEFGPMAHVAAEVLAWIRENRPEGEGLPESVAEYFRER